jgi:threonine/homoserine/homoserine lactone efflux protein
MVATSGRPTTNLRQGFLPNAPNPRSAVSHLSAAVHLGGNRSPKAEALLLSAIFAVLYLVWFSSYVAAVDRLGRWVRTTHTWSGTACPVRVRIDQQGFEVST